MVKKIIGIIFGGRSSEHEVSLMSAASVIRAIDKDKYDLKYIGITKEGKWKHYKGNPECIEEGTWEKEAEDFNPGNLKEEVDFALPIIHGPYCEDGKLQGMLEMLDIPYGGCGVLASAVAMDKQTAKEIFRQNGLPICKHTLLTKAEVECDMEAAIKKTEEETGFPCFVKPANMGSSVGITKVSSVKELEEAVKLALKFDRRVVIEQAVNCREIETGIIGNDYPEAAEVGEILPSAEFYDYEAKYSEEGGSKLCIPAELSKENREKIRAMAVKAYSAIDGAGFARVDFFIDKDTGSIYLNEINTIPGFTKYSMFPLLWEAAGVSYRETIERIIKLGYERYNAKNNR